MRKLSRWLSRVLKYRNLEFSDVSHPGLVARGWRSDAAGGRFRVGPGFVARFPPVGQSNDSRPRRLPECLETGTQLGAVCPVGQDDRLGQSRLPTAEIALRHLERRGLRALPGRPAGAVDRAHIPDRLAVGAVGLAGSAGRVHLSAELFGRAPRARSDAGPPTALAVGAGKIGGHESRSPQEGRLRTGGASHPDGPRR